MTIRTPATCKIAIVLSATIAVITGPLTLHQAAKVTDARQRIEALRLAISAQGGTIYADEDKTKDTFLNTGVPPKDCPNKNTC